MKRLAALLPILFLGAFVCRSEVLIVADEFPAMEILAQQLKAQEGIASSLVKQDALPASLAAYQAVVVYIHKALSASAEKAFINYATNGGRLICLHHSISSGKKTNEQWYAFLGVDLPKKNVDQGGYKWIEGIEWEIVNLAPAHFITSNKISYEKQIGYTSEDGVEKPRPGFLLEDSEVYINHVFSGPRTVLLGFKYKDAKTGKLWMQDRAGWCRPVGHGLLVYLMPGHSVREFQQPAYVRMVVNSVIYKP